MVVDAPHTLPAFDTGKYFVSIPPKKSTTPFISKKLQFPLLESHELFVQQRQS